MGGALTEFELRMAYTTPPMRIGINLLAILFPFWGILLPAALALFLVILLSLPANIPLTYSLVLIGSLLATTGICALVAFLCDDDEIRVSKAGLCFPLRFLPALRLRRQYKWDELGSISLNWHRNTTYKADEAMTLFFTGGGYAKLKLQHLNADELEQFFIAFESCALNCTRDAELPDFEMAIQARDSGVLSHTQLWEKSLAQRFSGATFTPLEPNTKLQEGRYQILRQLSFGGFAAVYVCRLPNGETVVLKESSFPQTDEVQNKATELFKREATILNGLNHSGIVKLIDYFLENGRHYLVLQHIEGMNLNRLVLQKGPQPAETVTAIARQLVDTLKYLHEQSPAVVHRDLTPDNLLLKSDGSVVLIDFGASKEIVSNFTGTVIGKQSYIAPEQFKGKPTPRSDIYSLGATLYFLSTGKQPEPLSQSNLDSEHELSLLISQCTHPEETQRPDCDGLLLILREAQSV